MAAATAAQIKTALSKVLKVAEASLPSYYDGITTSAATFGYQEVLGRLLNRGFRKTEDVDEWDRLYEFTLDLGLWKAITLSGAYDEQPDSLVESLDRREELDKVLLFVDGEWVKPTGDKPGLVTFGGAINQSSGVFQWNESDETNRGIHV